MKISECINGLKKIFGSLRYFCLFFLLSFLILTGFAVWNNIDLMNTIIFTRGFSLLDRLVIFFSQFPIYNSIKPLPYDLSIISVSVLIGLNITIFIRQYAENRINIRGSASSGLGTTVAVLGAGCVACGTAFLGGVLSLFGLSGALVLLPYGGKEIIWISILLMILATYINSRELGKSTKCEV